MNLADKYWSMDTLVSRVVDIQGETIDRWFPKVKSPKCCVCFDRNGNVPYPPRPPPPPEGHYIPPTGELPPSHFVVYPSPMQAANITDRFMSKFLKKC